MKVIKRDGRKVAFDKEKIKNAIISAFKETDNEVTQYAKDKAREIANTIEENELEEISVEAIQDLIENKLMASNRKDVAKCFILYRNNRTSIREKKTKVMMDVAEKLRADNVQNQNANVDEKSFGGRMGEANETVLKQFALDNCMSKKARDNHINNRIYTHDLGSYAVGSHNCLTIPYTKLLANGFNTRQTDVRPANSVNTELQLVAVIAQLQSLQQFGGVSANCLDWVSVPYVRKSFRKHYIDGLKYIENINDEELFNHIPIDAGIEDEEYKIYSRVYKYAMDMTLKETQQAVEGLYHNLSNNRAA